MEADKMKKKIWLLGMLCIILFCNVGTVASAKTKAKWKIAYDNFFSKEYIEWDGKAAFKDLKFTFLDVDKNGVPELILNNPDSSSASGKEWLYGYRNGKIEKLVHEIYWCHFAYDEKHKMLRLSGGKYDRWDEIYYVIKKSRAISVASRVAECWMTEDGKEKKNMIFYNKEEWAKGAQRISSKKFSSIVKGEYKNRNPITNSKEKDFKSLEKKFKPATRKYLNKYLGAPVKGKVVKVTTESLSMDKNYKYATLVKGIDKNKNVIWKYKTPKQIATEISTVVCKVQGNSVYIVTTGGYYIRLNKSNGKVLYSKKKKALIGATDLDVDKNGNCFISAFYANFLMKISKSGKIIWRRGFDKTGLYWPYGLKLLNSGKILLMFDGFDYDKHSNAQSYRMILSQKTGKVLSGKYL